MVCNKMWGTNILGKVFEIYEGILKLKDRFIWMHQEIIILKKFEKSVKLSQ